MAAAGLGLALLTGCAGGGSGATSSPTAPAPATSPGGSASATSGAAPSGPASAVNGRPQEVEVAGTVASGLDVPWGITFDPAGAGFVAERPTGRVLRVVPGQDPREAGRIPGVADLGEGGLLGLAYVARGAGVPASPADRLYAYFTSDEGDNRIVRLDVTGSRESPRLGPPTVVLDGIPRAGNHNGGRIVLGPDGHLWVGTGDAGDGEHSQDKNSLAGKILRIDLDGGPAEGNPFGNRAWSYGHRNVQGLAFDSAGRLWATEFGQNAWDELNLVVAGGNYGWPFAEGREGPREAGGARLIEPRAVWTTDEASPSGLAIVDDVAYLAGLRGRRLWQVPLREDGVGTPRPLLGREYGRLRTVEVAPSGGLWLSTSNRDGRGQPARDDDRILRLTLR